MADELIFRLTVEDAGSATLGAFERKLKGLETDAKTLSGSMKTAFGNVGGYIVNFAADAAREFGKFSKESVDAFLKFETAMVAVAKTTGIPKENLGKFSEQIRETAVDLKGLGKDAAVQIASIAEVAGQLGISADKLAKGDFEAASQEILGFSTTIAKAKIALPEFTGGVEQIATVVAKQIQLFGETPAAAEQYLSVMNKLSDTTAATAVEISSFLSKFTIAPTLKIAQEEAASWGATFVSLGQNASDSATRMQSAYAMVLKGSKDTDGAINGLFEGNSKMAAQLEQLAGRSIEQAKSYSNLAREAIGKDANEAMKLFVTTLSEVESSSERAEIAFKMFGQVGARSILTLIPELPKLSDAAKEAATVFLSTNEQALDSLAKMSGVSRKEFSDNADFMAAVYKKDMPDAIRVLVTEINKIDDEQEKARVASQVFGDDWQVAMNKAQGGVKLFDEALLTAQKEIEATKNGASSIEQEYKTALDKVGTSFSELTAIVDDIKLQWGAPLAEALSAGIKLAIPVLDELRKNFMGVVEEFGRELGGESLASAFRQTAEAFKGSIEEMGANTDTFIAALKEQFTLPNLFATAMQQWSAFAVWLGDSAAALAKSVASSLSGIGSGFTNEEYKAEMEDVFSPDQYLQTADAIKEVSAAAEELNVVYGNTEPPTTQEDLDALIQLKNANIELLQSNTDLRAEYQGVARDLSAAIESGQAPTAELTARMESLRQKIADVGVEAYGNSTFPDMTAAMMTSQAQSQALTAEMAAMQAQIKGLGAEYEATDKQIREKQDSIRDLNTQIREQQTLLRTASEAEKEGIQNAINQIRNKKDAIQSEISDLQELSRDQKEARKAEEDALKESIQQIKEKQKAVDELAKNIQRTAELRAKQQQEEAKAANDLYREQQKQAADSIKWINDLDEATKKRVLGEKDAVKILEEQGVTLTDLQAQEVRRMQGAYKTEEAYQAQAEALQAQLDSTGTLIAAGEKLSGSLGGLADGIGKIGGIFDIDTSGIENVLGKIQGFAQLPQTIKGITDSIGGIGQALGGLGNIGSSLSGMLGSLGEGISGLVGSLGGIAPGISSITTALGSLASMAGPVAALSMAVKGLGQLFGSDSDWYYLGILPGLISDLFKNTKSEGTEAAEAFQKFVAANVSGGAQMASALKTNFDAMTAAGFDFQTFLQQTGTTMDQTFGGISANWQQGSTAMDLFTQAVGRATGDMAKAPQVALQMMASFQDMGLSAEEAGAKMLEIATAAGLSQSEIDKLKASLEGASNVPPLEVSVNVDTQPLNAGLEEVKAMVSNASAYMNETGATWLDFIDEAEFSTLAEKIKGLGESGVISAEQMNALLPMIAKIGEDGRVTVEEMQQLQTAMQGLSVAGSGLSASLQTMSFSADASRQGFEILGGSLDQLRGKVSDSQFETLSSQLQQIASDGQLTSTEIYAFGTALQSAGLPVGELKTQLVALAEASGLSGAELITLQQTLGVVGITASEASAGQMALKAALDEATGSAAALDNELVGNSLVPSLQMLSESAAGSVSPMIALTDATVQAATGTKDATTGVDALKAALAGGGEEGAVTTGVFDAATQSVTQLTTKTGELSQSLTGVTSQLAGTGAEGALTTGMFGTANAAATGLDATTKTLASDLTGLTNQLSGAGSEGLATSNVFTATDGTATSLQSSVSFMSGSISTSAAQFAAATQQANAYAASLQRVNSAARQTGGGAPRMADGGTVQQGFAIVNERGSEIANIPGVGMMLMTQPGPVLGAFPKGTEIIPHGRSMELLSRFPGIPRMATGGTVGAMVAPVINITITGNTIANNVDIKNIAKQVSAEISRNYNARR